MDTHSIDQARAQLRAVVISTIRRLLPASESPRVAAYVPLRTEPASVPLLEGLAGLGADVIVPVLLPDNDLDWQAWGGSGALLGTDSVATASLVLVPALAVGRDGTRLGRGGGSYDRALARVPAGVPTVALLFDGELREAVPREQWDVPVSAVAMPSGWVDLTGS